ncbi:hypothetical protein BGW36DRAFT_286374 [Talaromyces proteolyticus]|uniref:Zn(2)-C6 fungal-type domain-containing protein n=1 Tax=Talaromyces proteolyticus TaxID=1131652 RepID=A0AAD4L3D2_9EURO|nr:uncharacterized protein BGW36DRAFT_286374 [Talaromyces proteolyticus]KAH8705855.1 hypothetical protein BGW36DRAFT_286374 [Talaromyces proteolyticus]
MPSRRFHIKSRYGCFRCKTRKVKCDMQKPVCGHCSRRNEECIFPKDVPKRPGASAGSFTHFTAVDHDNDSKASGSASNMNYGDTLLITSPSNPDQMLLDNFSSRVSRTMSHIDDLQKVWAVNITRDSYSHSHLMHGLLAVSALHFSQKSTTPKADANHYRSLAIDHHNFSVSLFRPLVTELTSENFDLLYANAMLILMFNSVFLGSTNNNSSSLPNDMVSIHELAKGVTILRAQALKIKSDSKLYQHYRDIGDSPPFELPEGISRTIKNIDKAVNCLPDFGDGSEKKPVYLQAVALLRYTLYGFFVNHDHPALLFVWVAMADRRYLDLLMASDIMALRILAHFGICLLQVGDEWCVNSLGKNIVNGVRRMFEREQAADVRGSGLAVTSSPNKQPDILVLPIHSQAGLPS